MTRKVRDRAAAPTAPKLTCRKHKGGGAGRGGDRRVEGGLRKRVLEGTNYFLFICFFIFEIAF